VVYRFIFAVKFVSSNMVKLFVGGFPLDITELELVQLFDPHATVSTVKIVRDKKTGTCKGYAFLEINDPNSADAAMEALNGYMMGDRVLSVKPVIEKPAPIIKSKPATDTFKKKRPRISH
jgi:RNA recognition motif-containing protein